MCYQKSCERNDFKLRFNGDYCYDPKFYVNKKDGIVTCKLQARLLTPDGDYSLFIPEIEVNGIGIAKCSPNDKFNEIRGKKIALAKAENNAYHNAEAYLKIQLKNLNKLINDINKFGVKSKKQCDHNIEYIEGVSDPDNSFYKEEVNDIKVGKTYYV